MIRVSHIISNLDGGGAETMLFRLLRSMDRRRFENAVVSLTGRGLLGTDIERLGVPVHSLAMQRGIPNPMALVHLLKCVRKSTPHIVHTWMYHANLMGSLVAKIAGDVPVVWAIHQANLDPHLNKRLTLWTANACAMISRWAPACVIFVSRTALQSHAEIGYAATKTEIIPNGFDLEQCRPDPTAGASVRDELGLPRTTPLIGVVAHFRPEKGHRTFVEAAAYLHAEMPHVHFLLCGSGVTQGNLQLKGWVSEAGIHSHCHLLGRRADISRLCSAMDIATSSSLSEAFPLAVGEAMACGTPCVVTDVGDSALIVGETGRVVPADNPKMLAGAWRDLMTMPRDARQRLGLAARLRIKKNYALCTVVERYQTIYTDLVRTTSRLQEPTPIGNVDSAAATLI